MANIELPRDAKGREIPLDTKILYDEDENEYEVYYYKYSVRQTIPQHKCHSTEHLHIETIDDNLTASRSVKVGCTECHTFAQIDYVFTGSFANERRPDDVQLTREGIERWNEHCDDWEEVVDE